MSLETLEPQPRMSAEIDAYSATCFDRYRHVVASHRSVLDLPYAAEGQTLDMVLPTDEAMGDLPVFVFLHGGGWCLGYKEWCTFMAPAIVSLPAILVAVDYRLIPSVAFPAPVEDAVSAIKWIYRNIANYGGAPDRIVIGGHSAGGQIAATAALSPGLLDLADLPRDVIKACFCLSTTFSRRMIPPTLAPDHIQPGGPSDIMPDSPLALAANAAAPFHIAWGGLEDPRLEHTGTLMASALTAADRSVTTEVYENENHFSIHLKTGDSRDAWSQAVRAALLATDRRAATRVAP
jgi:arylformamidase